MTAGFAAVFGRRSSRVKRLRRWCLDQLASLNITVPCDIVALCEVLSEQRQRTIHLIPVKLGQSHSCGVWVRTSTDDFVLYEAETSRAHQDHIIAHELAHIICWHKSNNEMSDTDAHQLFPDIDPNLVRDMLRRTSYSDAIEQEAEMMAYLIRVATGDLVTLPSPGIVGALETAMGYRNKPFD